MSADRLRSMRTRFALSLKTFARMVQLPQSTVRGWEAGTAELTDEASRRVRRVAKVLGSLAKVMQSSFIPTWMERPNAVCRELGVRTPLDLFARQEYKEIESMIWYLGSGTPD